MSLAATPNGQVAAAEARQTASAWRTRPLRDAGQGGPHLLQPAPEYFVHLSAYVQPVEDLRERGLNFLTVSSGGTQARCPQLNEGRPS